MNFRSRIFFITAPLLLGVSLAYANPSGMTVVAGNATSTSIGNTETITTTSNRTIANFSGGLNIAADESTVINQPNTSSAFLGRDISGNPTNIFGSLSSNGQIFLVNPNGILFGPNSKVNAPAILASTLNITNNNFLNSNYIFFKERHKGNAYIINQGRLAATPGGYVALLSQAVNNQGIIIANRGTVALASGSKMTVALDSQNQISVAVDDAVKSEVIGLDGQPITSAIQNSGTIKANGGKVLLTAKVLNDVFDFAVNNSGVIQAKSLNDIGGSVQVVASGAPVINTGKIKAAQVNISDFDSNFINTGKIQANQINISIPESTLINQGQVISKYIPSFLNSGNISIQALDIQQDGLISADQTVDIITNDIFTTVNSNPFQKTSSFPVIKGNQVNLTVNNIGSSALPVTINAANLVFNLAQGDLNIGGSSSDGTNVLLRGPPAGFGSLIYNSDTNLTLDASFGSINVGEGVNLAANNLSLQSKNGIYSSGSLNTPNLLSLISLGADLFFRLFKGVFSNRAR